MNIHMKGFRVRLGGKMHKKANDKCEILISDTNDDNGWNLALAPLVTECFSALGVKAIYVKIAFTFYPLPLFIGMPRMLYEFPSCTEQNSWESRVLFIEGEWKKVGMIHSGESNSIAPLIPWRVGGVGYICFTCFGYVLILSVLICEYCMWSWGTEQAEKKSWEALFSPWIWMGSS
jgi:hypothetical protein